MPSSPITITTASTAGTPALANDVDYAIVIRALNNLGTGASSNLVHSQPALAVPDAPSAPQVTAGDGSADIVLAANPIGGGVLPAATIAGRRGHR